MDGLEKTTPSDGRSHTDTYMASLVVLFLLTHSAGMVPVRCALPAKNLQQERCMVQRRDQSKIGSEFMMAGGVPEQ
jgi:hypothetical protein